MNKPFPRTITSAQLRAARALLDWSRAQCAAVVGVSAETIKNIEQETFAPTPATLERILAGFSAHGVEFFSQHGVTLKDDPAKDEPETLAS